MSWFLCLFSVSLCGGNGLGGQWQCGTYPGLLQAKMMLLTIIYRLLPPSLLFPLLCVICDIYQSPMMWDSLWGRRAEGFKQVEETQRERLLFGELGDPSLTAVNEVPKGGLESPLPNPQ